MIRHSLRVGRVLGLDVIFVPDDGDSVVSVELVDSEVTVSTESSMETSSSHNGQEHQRTGIKSEKLIVALYP